MQSIREYHKQSFIYRKCDHINNIDQLVLQPQSDGTYVEVNFEPGDCKCERFTSLPICRLRFWKILFLVFLVLSTVNFTVTLLNYERRPLFTVSRFLRSNNTWKSGSSMQKFQNFSVTSYSDQVVTKKGEGLNESIQHNDSNRNFSSGGFVPGKVKSGFGSRETLSAQGLPSNYSELKLCPPVPPDLEGPIKVTTSHVPSLETQENNHPELSSGGRFKPAECKARDKVAIIIPFRDRASHLAVFLYNIHPFLQKQQIDYSVFVIEQKGKTVFNRASLLNIGYLEALKLYPYDCFIFHDIDLIPEDDRNLYTCPLQPRHMSVAINIMGYKLIYEDLFGGVSALTTEQFRTVNGFSNRFWGWGAEDDDMSNRIRHHNYHISRYPANIARYTMMPHKKDRPNPLRFKVLNEGKKYYAKDGLNNIKYKVLSFQLKKLFTWITVQVKRS